MRISASLLRKLANLLVVFAFVAGLWAANAQAATDVYPVTGNARYQIGNGLPIPIGFTPPPTGKIKFPPGGVIEQTTGPDPKAMINRPPGATHPGTPAVIGVFPQNSAVFQVYTALPLGGSAVGTNTFSAGGRTGVSIVSWCPGKTATLPANPGCALASQSPGINGSVRFTKTSNQFGGTLNGPVGGKANVALRVSGTPPGSVTAIFALASPFPTGAQGAPFGFKNSTLGGITPPPNGVGGFIANANGTLLTQLWAHPSASGQPNPVTEYGVPWTTGRITVSVTANVGPSPEIFVMTGSDNRVNGVGTISLVTGSVSARLLSGPNANRGWLNYTIGAPLFPGPIPAIANGGLAAVFGLVALAGGYALWRRRS